MKKDFYHQTLKKLNDTNDYMDKNLFRTTIGFTITTLVIIIALLIPNKKYNDIINFLLVILELGSTIAYLFLLKNYYQFKFHYKKYKEYLK